MNNIFADYAARGKNSWWRYLVVAVLAFVIQTVLVGVGMAIAMVAMHLKPEDVMTLTQDASQPIIFFAVTGGSFGALMIGFAAAALWLNKKTPGDMLGRWSWPAFAAGLLVWLGILIANIGIDYMLQPAGFVFTMGALSLSPVLVTCAGLAVQTFAEEFIFRGWLTQGIFKAVPNIWLCALISGLIFGACHIPNGLPQAVNATILGVALSWITIRTGGIAFAYGMHMINNIFGAVVVVSGGDVFKGAPALITQTTPSLNWWDVAYVAIALTLIILVMTRRSASKTLPVQV